MKTAFMTIALALSFFAIAQNETPRPVQNQVHSSFIQLNTSQQGLSPNQIFSDVYQLTPDENLNLVSELQDDLGQLHKKYQQLYKGIPVEGAQVTLHYQDNAPTMITGYFAEIGQLNVKAQVQNEAALNRAKTKVNAKVYAWESGHSMHMDMEEPEGELVVFTDNNGFVQPKLAYKIDVYALEPLYRADVFVDATNGDILFENPRIHDADVAATGTSSYNGNVSFTADQNGTTYRLRQVADGIETFDLNNGTNYGNATDVISNSTNFTSDPTAIQAHWGAEQTHGYFQQKHNRNSYNGSGAVIRSYVHYASGYVNAFWDGSRMTYGDGDGVNYGPLVSLDIVGHEIAHGVTEYSANLVYQRESGALNESFSDIFGEAIENYATGSNNWQMGTDIGIGGSGAIRSMNNPNAFGDPDTYGGSYWKTPNCGTPSQSNDYCGVHSNSGVQNKWFYILSQGESGTNDIGSNYNVSAIGIDKAATIAYRNLTVYLSTNSTFADARAGAIQSAEDLYGVGSAEVIATTNAWYAVGVGSEYGTIGYCNSAGGNSSYEWIANVTVGAFSNSSGAAGYTDFTGQTINVNAGQNYSVSLSPAFSGSVYQEYWKIWIDYNADGDFDDAGELAFDPGSMSSATVNGSLSIPAGASGITRMRVSMKWNAAQTACESFSYGEVEDYTIDVGTGGGGDVIAPSAPGSLAASSITQTSANLNWTASTDNVGVDHYNVYVGGSLQGTTTGTSYSVSGLTANTTYTLTVDAEDAAGNISSASSVNITTAVVPDNTAPTPPSSLSASSITQTSANLNWTASTDNVGVDHYNVYVGGSLQGTTTGTSYSVSGLTANTAYTFTVDAEDAAGNTSSASSVTITTSAAVDNTAPTMPSSLSASNTTQTSTDLSWGASTDNVGVDHYNVYVNGGLIGTTTSASASVTSLSANTTYTMSVEAEDAVGNTSGSVSINVTTLSGGGGGPVVLSADYFESGWDGWSDGGSDCARYGGTRSWEGNYSIRLRDNSGTKSAMTSSSYDLTPHNQVEVEFYFYPNSMENNEDFWLRYYDGSSWVTVGSWARGTAFNNNAFYTSTVTLSNANYAFPSNAQFRFQCDASGNGDRVYIEQVIITGSTVNNFMTPTGPVVSINKLKSGNADQRAFDENELRVYPVPAHDYLNIETDLEVQRISIYALDGKMLIINEGDDLGDQIDVSALLSGAYILRIETEDEVITKKFTKE
jgi:bacillolysin